jgi:integrase
MSKVSFTPATVLSARPKRRHGEAVLTEISDTTKGLRLVLFPSGAKSWIVRYRAGGRSRKLTLGPAVTLDKGEANPEQVLTVSVARKRAAEAQIQIEQGHDPAFGKAQERQQRQDRQAAAAETFGSIAEAAFKRWTSERKDFRTADRQLADLTRLVFPVLGKRPIATIKRTDIVKLLDEVSTENGPTIADKMLSVISKVMQDYAKRHDSYSSPIIRGMHRTSAKERKRSRVLDEDELRAVWKAASEDGIFGCFVKFLLLTAARRNEAALMTWAEVNGGGTWTLPAARNKVKVELVRPLSGVARSVLAGIPRTGDLVFQQDGRKVVADFNGMKKNFDQRCGVTDWTLHDLRRTARTLLSRAGINSDHSERCLGHVIGGMRGVYDKHEFFNEKKHAFEALARTIQNIVKPQRGKVVQLRGE